jgi:hypothetical protein
VNKKTILITLIIFSGLVGLVAWAYSARLSKPNPDLDKFAQCLTDRKVVMYGAYWCPHCQRQKKLFGDSLRFLKYVECTQDVNACQQKNISGYPTWVFEDGSRIEGEATLKELAEKSTCQAPL